MTSLAIWARNSAGLLRAAVLLIVVYGIYTFLHPRGFSGAVALSNANQALALGLVAMAQALVILTRGIDLSLGAIMVLSTCLASVIVNGSPVAVALGVVGCIAAGLGAGLLNGCLVVYGRLQPLIVTLATGALFLGLAMYLRPAPGGEVDTGLSMAATGTLGRLVPWLDGIPLIGALPISVLLMLAVVLLFWLPFRRTVIGRGVLAVGSSEKSAYLSGLSVPASRIAAYVCAGGLAALAGLFVAFLTGSGDAKAAQAGVYTLNSIAAVVLGGTSLAGGMGGLVGPLLGAIALRTITSMTRVTDTILWIIPADPLVQPLFEGLLLLAVVSLGALQIARAKNRLEMLQ